MIFHNLNKIPLPVKIEKCVVFLLAASFSSHVNSVEKVQY